jgi:hypothetical protein
MERQQGSISCKPASSVGQRRVYGAVGISPDVSLLECSDRGMR